MKKYKFPSTSSLDVEEQQLGRLLASYISKATTSFDEQFVDYLRTCFQFEYTKDKSQKNKEAIFNFIKINKRRPSLYGELEERRLYSNMRNYMYSTTQAFDFEFKKAIDNLCPVDGYKRMCETGQKNLILGRLRQKARNQK